VTLTEALGADNYVGLNTIAYTAGLIFDRFRGVFTGRTEHI
jgi:hypothetical protein